MLIQRGLLPVQEIIVHCNGMGMQSMGRKLNGQPVGKCGLTRGGGPRDHDKLLVSRSHDLICNLGYFALLERFGNEDQFVCPLLRHLSVQIPYGVCLHHLTPAAGLLLHLEYFRLRMKRRHSLRVFLLRKLEHESLVVGIQIKIFEISRMIYHEAVKIILKITQTVYVDPGYPAVPEQFLLVIHSVVVENFNGLVRAHAPLQNGDSFLHKLQHVCLDLSQEFFVYLNISVDGEVIS